MPRQRLEPTTSMISNTSRRLPQKTCGLFDTGLAGDTAVVTSLPALQATPETSLKAEVLEPTAAAVEGLKSWPIGLSPDPAAVGQGKGVEASHAPLDFLSGGDAFIAAENNNQLGVESNDGLEDWGLDFLDPLGGLDDPTMDAFMDLGPLLENNFLEAVPEADEASAGLPVQPQQVVQVAEVEPIIQLAAVPKPVFTTETEPLIASVPEPATKLKGRKRKRQASFESKVPMTKKTKESSAAAELKDSSFDHNYIGQACSSTNIEVVDKQAARRIKNNIASKRSREQRKQKFVEMDDEAQKLEVENDRLRLKIIELEKMAKEMKAVLVAKMAGKC